jgi:hypothetical protein
VIVTLFAATISAPAASDSEIDGKARPGSFNVLMIASREQEALSKETIQAVRGQLSDLPAVLIVEWVDRIPDEPSPFRDSAASISKDKRAGIAFWCDLDEAKRVYLLLVGKTELVERSLRETGEGGRAEAIALIVRAVVKSEIEKKNKSDQAQRDRDNKEQEPLLEPLSNQSRQSRMSVHLGYALEVQDASRPVAQGFGVGLGFWMFDEWLLFSKYVFWEHVLLSAMDVEIELRRHPVWLGLCFAKKIEPVRLGAELALILDYVKDRTEVPDSSSVEAERSGGGFLFSATLQGLVSVRILASIEIFLLLGAEVPVVQPRYVIDDNGARTVLEPWPIRPIGSAGVMVGFF